jgi:hypothetical protein
MNVSFGRRNEDVDTRIKSALDDFSLESPAGQRTGQADHGIVRRYTRAAVPL